MNKSKKKLKKLQHLQSNKDSRLRKLLQKLKEKGLKPLRLNVLPKKPGSRKRERLLRSKGSLRRLD